MKLKFLVSQLFSDNMEIGGGEGNVEEGCETGQGKLF
jgi:hypothetical protein